MPCGSPRVGTSGKQLLGHTDKDQNRRTAKHLGWEITCGGFKLREACTVGKAKQKNVPKTSVHKKAKSP
eukprot:15355108-Ditylum_brightwellii.AAC.2